MGDMTVWERPNDIECVLDVADDRVSLEDCGQGLDFVLRPVAEVGDGAFFDLAVLAPALAQQNGGSGASVGHGLDVHGNHISRLVVLVKGMVTIYMGTFLATRERKKGPDFAALREIWASLHGELRASGRPLDWPNRLMSSDRAGRPIATASYLER
jgi:hypothetical protein